MKLKNSSWMAAAVLALFCSAPAARAGRGYDVIVDVMPGSLLVSSELDAFRLRRESATANSVVIDEEETSLVSLVPGLNVGLSVEESEVMLQGTVGTGLLLNSRFRALLLRADAAAEFHFGQTGTIGPHVGLIYFTNGDWYGDGSADFSDEGGLVYGGRITIGHDITFIASLDVIDTKFDVTANDGWVASKDKLDISGIMINFGVRGRF